MKRGHGAVAKVRRVVKSGDSLYVCIPPEFIRKHRLKPGDLLGVVANSVMKVIPVKGN